MQRRPSARILRSVVVASCVLGGAVVLLLVLYAVRPSDSGESRAGVERDEPVSLDVVDQWTRVAQELGVPQEDQARVVALLTHALERVGRTHAQTPHPDLRDSLRVFLEQFSYKFGNPQERGGFSYTIVWLLADAVARTGVSPPSMGQAREQFSQYVDIVGERVRSGFEGKLGPDFATFAEQIDKGIQSVRQTTLERFDALQKDPLFPAFKVPMSEEALAKAIQSAPLPDQYDSLFREPLRMMVLKEETYPRRIRGFLEERPKNMLFAAAYWQIAPRLLHSPYWQERLTCTAGGTMREAYWPIDLVFFIPQKAKPAPSVGPGSEKGGAEPP